jgi:hypothetical protein
MQTLSQLETQLRATGQFWRYATRVEESTSEQTKIEIAQVVFASEKSWAEGLAAEFATKTYPPGYSDDQ